MTGWFESEKWRFRYWIPIRLGFYHLWAWRVVDGCVGNCCHICHIRTSAVRIPDTGICKSVLYLILLPTKGTRSTQLKQLKKSGLAKKFGSLSGVVKCTWNTELYRFYLDNACWQKRFSAFKRRLWLLGVVGPKTVLATEGQLRRKPNCCPIF